MPQDAMAKLEADWTSGAAARHFEHNVPYTPISVPSDPPVGQPMDLAPVHRTQYLANLRAAVRQLQDEVNETLTAKMAEEAETQPKVRGVGAKRQRQKEQQDEDFYGEEIVEP